jgi:hypothetical protein
MVGSARTIRGTVVGPDGSPVPNIQVHAILDHACASEGAILYDARDGIGSVEPCVPYGAMVAWTTTDAEGAFTLRDVPASRRVTIRSDHHRNGTTWSAWAWCPAPAEDEPAVLRIPRAPDPPFDWHAGTHPVRVRLVDARGEPLPPGDVLYSYPGSRSPEDSVARGDDVLTLHLPPGRVHVTLQGDDLGEIETEVVVSAFGISSDVTIPLSDEPMVRARVVLPHGLEETDVAIYLVPLDESGDPRPWSPFPVPPGRVDGRPLRSTPSGQRVAKRVSPGRWRLVAEVLGDDSWTVVDPPEIRVEEMSSQDVVVTLARDPDAAGVGMDAARDRLDR